MIGIIAAALVACDARVSPNASQMRADQAKPIVTAPLAPPLSEAELRRSILFRGAFGLRSDVSWIMAVAADAASERGATDFGVPLLPEEIKDLLRRTHATPEIVDVILDYSRTIPDDWIGLKTDPKPGGQVVVAVSRDDDWHQGVLTRLLPEGSRFDVRLVEQSAVELAQFAVRVRADRAWFESIGTRLLGVEIKPIDGVAEIMFAGLDATRSSDIVAHFGGYPWIRTSWASIPQWTGSRGDLVIEAADHQGQPVKGLECAYWAIDPAARYGSSIGFNTTDEGLCRIEDLPVSSYDLELWFGGEGEWTTVGTARVELRANRSTKVRIIVDLP